MSFNRWTGVGNLGRDCEIRFTQDGTAVANFSIATTEKWKDANGNKQERTEWVKIVLWGKVAEALQEFLIKGKQVLVEGKLQTRKWKDRDGNDRYTTEVKADRVVLLGGGGGERGRRRGGRDDQSRAGTDEDGSQESVQDQEDSSQGESLEEPEDPIPF